MGRNYVLIRVKQGANVLDVAKKVNALRDVGYEAYPQGQHLTMDIPGGFITPPDFKAVKGILEESVPEIESVEYHGHFSHF